MDQMQQLLSQHTQAMAQFCDLSAGVKHLRAEAEKTERKADFVLEQLQELTQQINQIRKQQQEAEAEADPSPEAPTQL